MHLLVNMLHITYIYIIVYLTWYVYDYILNMCLNLCFLGFRFGVRFLPLLVFRWSQIMHEQGLSKSEAVNTLMNFKKRKKDNTYVLITYFFIKKFRDIKFFILLLLYCDSRDEMKWMIIQFVCEIFGTFTSSLLIDRKEITLNWIQQDIIIKEKRGESFSSLLLSK